MATTRNTHMNYMPKNLACIVATTRNTHMNYGRADLACIQALKAMNVC
jgi:hypothetical protein